jgi:hypothetical protein
MEPKQSIWGKANPGDKGPKWPIKKIFRGDCSETSSLETSGGELLAPVPDLSKNNQSLQV